MREKLLLVFLMGSVLAACSTPLPMLSDGDVPAEFEQKAAADAPIWPEPDWWRKFSNTELDNIIASSQQGNLDLAAAEARLLQADARARIAGANLVPNVSLGADASRRIVNDQNGNQTHGDTFGSSLGASYELDFWGSNRAQYAAAKASYKASEADRQTVALTVTSGTANAYFQLLSLRDRLAIARMNLQNAEEVYQVTAARVHAGAASPLEEVQQLATLAGQRAQIPSLALQELEARNALAVLLGRPPEGFDVAEQNLESTNVPEVAPGLTSELLARRPDIVTAEANLRAANANVAVARAAFFPSVTLTGSGGIQSTELTSLFNSGWTFNLGVGLVQTIFDGGRLAAQSEEAKAREDEVLANYRKTVISAFSDVESALGSIAYLAEQQSLQAEQVAQLERAFEIAQVRYREGVAIYLTVLEAQRTLYQARDQLGQIKLDRLQAAVGLYRALGGGWRDPGAPVVAER